jgi:hypothetical protein
MKILFDSLFLADKKIEMNSGTNPVGEAVFVLLKK